MAYDNFRNLLLNENLCFEIPDILVTQCISVVPLIYQLQRKSIFLTFEKVWKAGSTCWMWQKKKKTKWMNSHEAERMGVEVQTESDLKYFCSYLPSWFWSSAMRFLKQTEKGAQNKLSRKIYTFYINVNQSRFCSLPM